MKIGIVSLNFGWQAGGNRQILELTRNLKKMGHAVTIYAPEANKGAFSSLQEGLSVSVVPVKESVSWNYSPAGLVSKIFYKLHQYRTQKEICRAIAARIDKDLDVINCHDYSYPVNYFYKIVNPSVRAVTTMCEPPYSYLPKKGFLVDIASRAYNWLLDLFERKYLLAADVVATTAPYEKEWIERRGGKGVVVWSGLNFERFYAPPRRYPKDKIFKLFAIGIPSPYRRYEDATYAVAALRKEGYDVRLTVVANNLWREDEYCEKLKKIVRDGNLGKYVHLRFDGVSEEELKNLYKTSHVFVYTNYVPPGRNGATWALVVSEAQAAGMPVVLYKNTGAAEPLTDGENAMLAETLDKDDVARKIKMLIDNPKLYKKIARGGQEFVRNNISWQKYTERMLKLFNGV